MKIRFLQCYEVLWTHNIDAICTYYIYHLYFIDLFFKRTPTGTSLTLFLCVAFQLLVHCKSNAFLAESCQNIRKNRIFSPFIVILEILWLKAWHWACILLLKLMQLHNMFLPENTWNSFDVQKYTISKRFSNFKLMRSKDLHQFQCSLVLQVETYLVYAWTAHDTS